MTWQIRARLNTRLAGKIIYLASGRVWWRRHGKIHPCNRAGHSTTGRKIFPKWRHVVRRPARAR